MMRSVKKLVALFLCLALLSANVFAFSYEDTDSNSLSENDLVESGYTREDAQRLLEFDRILKKMDSYGQVVDINNDGVIYISNDANDINHLTISEANLVITMMTEYIQEQSTATRTRAAAYSELMQEIEENPTQRVHTVKISENSYLKATTIITDTSNPSELSLNSSGPIIQDQYQFFDYGYKDINYELEEFAGIYYAKSQIKGRATSTATSMTLTKLDHAQASIGAISIQNVSLDVMQDIATEVGDYCQASNNVVFAISASVGANILKGVISISLSAGANWTQKAIIRAHKTSAYGIVWTLADVYTV